MFSTFDAPSREAICTRRVATNTPLQSLTTLNDPTFVDAARGLARRILAEPAGDARSRLVLGFRLATARRPDERELERLRALLEGELRSYGARPEAARRLALAGEVQPAAGTDPVEFAAWTVVANVLLNLDETVTKG
jgi:hypothetical protein